MCSEFIVDLRLSLSRTWTQHTPGPVAEYLAKYFANGMSVWLPQASRHVQRVTVRRSSVSLKYGARELSSLRRIPRHYSSFLNYYPLIAINPNYHPGMASACRSYATSTPPNGASSTPSNVESASNVPAEPEKPWKTRVWEKVKHEAAHYWHGSKLLVSEMRISLRLVFSLLNGNTLTRREKRQVRGHRLRAQKLADEMMALRPTATKNNDRSITTRAILSIRRRAVHGAITPCSH
jgi:hypothetical protein